MKKYLLFTIALFAALALQSCKDDKTDEPNPGPDPEPTVEYDVDTVSSICEGIYFGDAYLSNDEVYTYYLSISDLPVWTAAIRTARVPITSSGSTLRSRNR